MGSKNATTPILAATLLAAGTYALHNVPRIEDVYRMLEILTSLGSTVEWTGPSDLSITTSETLTPEAIDVAVVKQLRSSILLLGPLAARTDNFTLYQPGGCSLGARPVASHIHALDQLGVSVACTDDGYQVVASGRKNGTVIMREMAVTPTENATMLASALPGSSQIRVAACEPHVADLCQFLVAMGADIQGIGTHTLSIRGSADLHSTEYTIMPDANEAGAFLALACATRSHITITHTRPADLDIVIARTEEFGGHVIQTADTLEYLPGTIPLLAVNKIDSRTYPGFPTDNLAPFAVVATQAVGETLIHETLFEGRMSYAAELEKMGARATVLNPHQLRIIGPTTLRGATVKSYDLRAGATVVIAALCAMGETIIEDIYQIDRGYENLDGRLRALGADIIREEA